MSKHVLFIQGAGEGAYQEDKRLAASLQQALGSQYEVNYPEMPDEDDASYELWKSQIEQEVATMPGPLILVGHSVGASVLLKTLTEIEVKKPLVGIFLLATPFWGGDGWTYEGYETLELPKDMASKLPKARLFFYHCHDDETVPYEHLALYAKMLPQATIRELEGGHQFNNDVSLVAKDIEHLALR